MSGKFELSFKLSWNVDAIGQLEANGSFSALLQGVENIDRQTIFIEDMGSADAVYLHLGDMEGCVREGHLPLGQGFLDVG